MEHRVCRDVYLIVSMLLFVRAKTKSGECSRQLAHTQAVDENHNDTKNVLGFLCARLGVLLRFAYLTHLL